MELRTLWAAQKDVVVAVSAIYVSAAARLVDTPVWPADRMDVANRRRLPDAADG